MKIALCVLIAAVTFTVPAAAQSSYDRDEEIRRAAEKLVQYDQQEREAAKQRYDEKLRREKLGPVAPTSTSTLVIFGIVMTALGYFFIARPFIKMWQDGREKPQSFTEKLLNAPLASQNGPLFQSGPNRARMLELSRTILLNFLNEQLSRGVPTQMLEEVFWTQWNLHFRITERRLKISDDTLMIAMSRMPEIRAYFETVTVE